MEDLKKIQFECIIGNLKDKAFPKTKVLRSEIAAIYVEKMESGASDGFSYREVKKVELKYSIYLKNGLIISDLYDFEIVE